MKNFYENIFLNNSRVTGCFSVITDVFNKGNVCHHPFGTRDETETKARNLLVVMEISVSEDHVEQLICALIRDRRKVLMVFQH